MLETPQAQPPRPRSWRRPASRRVKGPVRHAQLLSSPPSFTLGDQPPIRGRRALGIRYEHLVHQEFLARYPGYLPSLWFRFWDDDGEKYCQPDGLLINPWHGFITIVECKYSHCPEAYDQLFYTYAPVVRALFGGLYRIACVEVCKWFDPAIVTAARPVLCKHPDCAPEHEWNVHIYNPRS